MTDRSTARAGSAISLATDPLHARLDRARLFSWVQTIGIVILFAVILATPGFLTEPSILSLLTTVSFIGCVAVGMTLITISGNIMSFALGATVGVTAMVFILAANRLGEIRGGFVVVEEGKVTGEIALPVAGLMSLEPYESVRDTLHHLRQAAAALGATLEEPFLQLAFLPLPVIPHLKISDRGMVDVDRFALMG